MAYTFVVVFSGLLMLYLARINLILKRTPAHFEVLAGPPWTPDLLSQTYKQLLDHPVDYTSQIPPRMGRRYIVTGGAGETRVALLRETTDLTWVHNYIVGLVGGYIVLQLLARETPAHSIRVLDIRKTERNDLRTGLASQVEFVQTDITSPDSVHSAFRKPWPKSIAHLPLTVFHTAAVIIPSARSKYLYALPEAVNVRGTENVLEAARQAGADIFSSTSSASISVRPVAPFVSPWAAAPRHFAQVLDEADFNAPLRSHEEFFGNYPASKAAAERLVCNANSDHFRTGCIRPGNGVYGNPTDNTVGGPLSKSVMFTWVPHIVQSFVHGANVAVAHLHHEAVLTRPHCPQAGRPFVVTDPNPPITYRDLYNAVKFLSFHPFYVVVLPPVMLLLVSFVVEWYTLLPHRFPFLRRFLPRLSGQVKYMQPGLFSICTHLVASDSEARKAVEEGGLGYRGVLTTLQGMVMEVLEWNREHVGDEKSGKRRKSYTISIDLAEKIQQLATSRIGNTEH